jgi:hypothetical protein
MPLYYNINDHEAACSPTDVDTRCPPDEAGQVYIHVIHSGVRCVHGHLLFFVTLPSHPHRWLLYIHTVLSTTTDKSWPNQAASSLFLGYTISVIWGL